MICIWSSWCHCHPIISCSSKIQNGLAFWCHLTEVVLEKRPINGCSSSSSLMETEVQLASSYEKSAVIVRDWCWSWDAADEGVCWSVCVMSVWVVCRQEPCSPTADKHDAGLRKQSAPVVHQIVQSNNSVVVPAHADVRKTEKGWAQFEEDCQGMQNICHFL